MTPITRHIPNNVWLLLLVAWTLFMALIGRQAFSTNDNAILRMAEAVADSHFSDQNAHRKWSMLHGGVYVPVSEQMAPNPYLAHLPERDIVTPSGRLLTLVNASYMSRQVYDLARNPGGVQVHITSLEPLRAANAPRDWERAGLEQLRRDPTLDKFVTCTEASEDGASFLRVVYPLPMTDDCRACHVNQVFAVGAQRGGFTVEVPLAPYLAAQAGTLAFMLFFCVLAWVGGLWLIELFRRYIEERLNHEARARLAVAASERRFRTLFDEAAHGSAVVDPVSGIVLAGNRALAQMIGQDEAALVGRSLDDLFVETIDLTALAANGTDAAAGMPLHLRVADHSRRDVECQAVRIELDGKPALHCAFYDITLRNLYLAETIRSSQMASLGELSAGVAHEINNPVGGVINYAQILLNRGTAGGMASAVEVDLLQRIVKEGERIAAIVRSLLAFSRAGGDQYERVALGKVVDDALLLIAGRLDKDGVALEVEMPVGLPPVRGNVQQLEQLVLNLVANARDSLNDKFAGQTAAGKQLRLTALASAGKLRLEVYDNGGGVTPALREKIFTPFFTTKPAEKGTGLGLSICAEIVHRHGGTIELDSRPGAYSRFIVWLPQAVS